MKKTITIGCVLLCVYIFERCGNGAANETNIDTVKNLLPKEDTFIIVSTDSAFMKSYGVGKYDENFATEAANESMTAIAISKLVKKSGSGKVLKDYAIMIIQDDGDALKKLHNIAIANKIILPEKVSDDSKKVIDSISKKKGINFNKEYVATMINDHNHAIDLFTKASMECKDSTLKNYAAQTLPALKRHLDYIEKISGKNKM